MQRTDSFEKTWCWEWLKVGGKGDDRGWDGWMASPTQWTWVWVSFGSWWWTGKPGVLLSMGSQRVGHDWATDLQYACLENPMDKGTWWATFQASQSVNHHWATNTFTFFFHIWISRVEFGGNNQFNIFTYFHSQLDSIKNTWLYQKFSDSQCIIRIQPGMEPVPPELKALGLNHWATSEVPNIFNFKIICSVLETFLFKMLFFIEI